MSFLIGPYDFDGPLINRLAVKPEAGLYAILSFARRDFELVEVAESENLRAALMKQDNLEYWQRKSHGMLTFSVHYCPEAGIRKRREMLGEILREFDGVWQNLSLEKESLLVAL